MHKLDHIVAEHFRRFEERAEGIGALGNHNGLHTLEQPVEQVDGIYKRSGTGNKIMSIRLKL